jgi:hypothetical protein
MKKSSTKDQQCEHVGSSHGCFHVVVNERRSSPPSALQNNGCLNAAEFRKGGCATPSRSFQTTGHGGGTVGKKQQQLEA